MWFARAEHGMAEHDWAPIAAVLAVLLLGILALLLGLDDAPAPVPVPAAAAAAGWCADRKGLGWRRSRCWSGLQMFAHFGGLVLGCIETNFCKQICMLQHFSGSTRFAHFRTAPNSTF